MTAGTTSAELPLWLGLTPGLPQSYPFKLQEALTARYTDQTISVGNAGYPGWAAWQLREVITDDVRAMNAEVVLLMAGANDLLNISHLSGPELDKEIQTAVDTVEDLLRLTVERGTPVMLATLPPQRPTSPPGVPVRGAAAPFLDRFNSGLKSIATKRGAMLVDVNAQLPLNLVGADGLHLTEAGNQRLAEIWFEALKNKYEVPVEPVPAPTLRSAPVQAHAGGVAQRFELRARAKRG
jgi:lysophospholipase L1-like esterase